MKKAGDPPKTKSMSLMEGHLGRHLETSSTQEEHRQETK